MINRKADPGVMSIIQVESRDEARRGRRDLRQAEVFDRDARVEVLA
jgi:hypothetical protein